MIEKVEQIVARYNELTQLMSQPEVATDPNRLREYGQEVASLEPLVALYREYRETEEALQEARAMLEDELDDEMEELVRDEIKTLEEKLAQLTERIKVQLLPKDPNDEKDVILEIRAGAGGDEAALFAADLARMYTRYAEKQGWKTDVISANETGIGGYKEIIMEIKGRGAYSRLKYESGVHRVQRVPATESSGRIHTSTATVAVLPEMDEVEIEINPEDLRIDVFRSGGHGGQSVNTTDSAVRITHLPTGIVVTSQDERSQLQNRQRAMKVLRARLYELEQRKRQEEISSARRSQVGTGERSEKIRTYNFPQNRVTDHRIGLTLYKLDQILDGELDEFIDELATTDQARRLAELEAEEQA
nr:peptide chain release factor 1 [Ardenticatena sp.]